MEELDKETIAELTKKKYDFDAIGAAVVAHTQDRSSFSNVFLDIFYDAEEEVSDDLGFLRWLATEGGNTVSGDAEEIYDFYTENKDAILAKAKEVK